jgi:hypothetical protein
MSETVDALLHDLLGWLAVRDRPYGEVMEAWRTSCPRMPVWEEATERGFVTRILVQGKPHVAITPAGRAFSSAPRSV